ncbi:hypothetical protein OUZ56_003056 [Daphnia magna]|uniref:Uncharacterized protein n=1 Tax=Daphnia magna TaxID=35525 RepID=A0ABR0A7W3_9CRUS|nr:hypothetical protein OUZ56_003056 [Daphnia magna]
MQFRNTIENQEAEMLLVVNGLQWPSRRTEPKTHRWDPIGLQIARRSFEASIDDLRITQG